MALDSWQLTGKLGYKSAGQAGSAWIDWQQQPSAFSLQLSGPFGSGATLIEGSNNSATLTRGGQQPITATTPEELTYLLFGWRWPVAQLHYWVRGLPHTTDVIAHQTYNELGLLEELEQAGWQLQFSRYQPEPSGLILPGKITGHTINQGNNLSFTLIAKNWQL